MYGICILKGVFKKGKYLLDDLWYFSFSITNNSNKIRFTAVPCSVFLFDKKMKMSWSATFRRWWKHYTHMSNLRASTEWQFSSFPSTTKRTKWSFSLARFLKNITKHLWFNMNCCFWMLTEGSWLYKTRWIHTSCLIDSLPYCASNFSGERNRTKKLLYYSITLSLPHFKIFNKIPSKLLCLYLKAIQKYKMLFIPYHISFVHIYFHFFLITKKVM